jgi:hypothetical protein
MRRSPSKPTSGILKYQKLDKINPSNQRKRKKNKKITIRKSSKLKSILMNFKKSPSFK